MLIKLAAKTTQPIGSKPKAFLFVGSRVTLTGADEYEQAKRYALGQLISTGRSWVSVEDGKCLYLIGLNPNGTIEIWERKSDEPVKPAKAA